MDDLVQIENCVNQLLSEMAQKPRDAAAKCLPSSQSSPTRSVSTPLPKSENSNNTSDLHTKLLTVANGHGDFRSKGNKIIIDNNNGNAIEPATTYATRQELSSERNETAEAIRAYCEILDAFEIIFDKLWTLSASKNAKNAFPFKTDSQLLLLSVKNELTNKLAKRLEQMVRQL